MAGKRELIEPNENDKRFVRRDDQGKFSESDDVGRSLGQDRKRQAKSRSDRGQGDKGDRSASSRGASTGSSSGGRSRSSGRGKS